MHEDDVDFVLVWDTSNENAISQESASKRQIFQRHLIEEGLKLQEEPLEGTEMQAVKIRAPTEVLRRYTEILNLRMPMKETPELQKFSGGSTSALFSDSDFSPKRSWFDRLTRRMELNPSIFPPTPNVFSATYSRDKEYLFDMKSTQNGGFFTHGIRSLIIDFMLRSNRYTEKGDENQNDFGIGIESLLSSCVYCGAYPLHDGDVKTPGSMRNLLSTEWGSLSKCFKHQPLDAINSYFGIKIAVYFAWLGFYTEMLIPVSILGIVAFLYGIFTLADNPITNDICNGAIVEPMCPHCDVYCGYWNIMETCTYAKITHLFDNDATIIFSVLMSFWTIIFLERWKRYLAELKYRWDLNSEGANDDNPRPNYLARLQKAQEKKMGSNSQPPVRKGPITEPPLDFWRTKLPNVLISLSTILFLIFMALAAIVSVILYRLAVKLAFFRIWAKTDESVHGWGPMITNFTAVGINLIFIVFFNWLYGFLAVYITELELHRTQNDFDDNLTLKMYILQFINYYASIFYIAFFKGRFAGTPHKYEYFLGHRHEECGSGGCMAELCIQLSIIMVGKQGLNALMEMGKPALQRWIKTHFKKPKDGKNSGTAHTQAARDLSLTPWNSLSLFPEYLEMVLQFGFSTIFVSAFPLAPFFALLNNIFEIRLDAEKLLKYSQRSVGVQVASIGIWFDILNSITKLAVLSNAMIIAFTSTFIPKLIYRMEFQTLEGFLNHSLASFNTSDFTEESRPQVEEHRIKDADICRYHSLDEGHDFYWEICVARLIFVILYQNGIFFGVMVIQWIIPDVPRHVQEKIRAENYIINKIVIRQERNRAKDIEEIDKDGECAFEKCTSTKMEQFEDSMDEGRKDRDENGRKKKKKLSGSGRQLSFTDSLEYVP